MNDFQKDHEGRWWFKTVDKGNKERQVAMSDATLAALKRWRKFQGLSALPSLADESLMLHCNAAKGVWSAQSIFETFFKSALIIPFTTRATEARQKKLDH